MLEKFFKKEAVETAKEIVKDNQVVVVVGAVVLTAVTIFAIRRAFPTVIVNNNYIYAGGCWSPYHIPGGFVR